MTAAIEEIQKVKKKVKKKKITWRDFTLEEHMRGFMDGVPGGCHFSMGIIVEEKDYKVYRVNVLDLKTETFIKSKAVLVRETPDGYKFEIWHADMAHG
jgi:hypothetical protein